MSREYFLGGATAAGFQTKFHELINSKGNYTYILKGGPGTGKSTLMRRVAEQFKAYNPELFYCSSDIRSLDAVYIEGLKVIIVDGTAPHVFDAELPGVSQSIINLGECWNTNAIMEKEDKIRVKFAENAKYHKRAKNLITALTSVNSSLYDFAVENVDKDAIFAYAERYVKDSLKDKEKRGSVAYKQIAAITSEGYLTRPVNSDVKVIGIDDPWYAASDLLLREIGKILINYGYNVVVSECAMLFKSAIEHIILPELNLQFSSLNKLNKLRYPTVINCLEFYSDKLDSNELEWAQKSVSHIEKEVAYSINKALQIHDDLESFYISSLDFEKLNLIANSIIGEMELRKSGG